MQKRSLHIGLNYPGTSSELYGCVNDAHDWANFFTVLGYEAVTMLEPGAEAILRGIQTELDGLHWGDRFVLTYSGHGSYIPDLNGDEIDGFDEVICPADFRNRLITDDNLNDALGSAATGVRRLMISDSCYSGNITRLADLATSGARRRFMPPSQFLEPTLAVRMSVARARGVPVNRAKVPAVLISGCADDEYSYDATFGRRPNGAFTRVAIDSYRSNDTMIRWFRSIRSGLPTADFPQTPWLTARLHQRYWKL